MAELRLLPLGVGDAFTARYYTTSLALGAGEDWLLIDCSHPIRKMLREASATARLEPALDLDRISGVVLSHLHADHCSGFEDYLFYCHYVLKRRGRLIAHPGVSARLADGVLGGSLRGVRTAPADPATERDENLADYLDVTPLRFDGPVTFGPFAIECRRTLHSIPTTALRVEAFGRVFGFSSDTSFDPTLIDWLAPADLIAHEVTTHPHSNVHASHDRLLALPDAIRAKLRLTHYPDDFDPDASAIEVLRQGRLYSV